MPKDESLNTLAGCILFTRDQAADMLNLSVAMIDKLRKAGELKACHVSTVQDTKRPKPLYHREELERFARSLPTDY